MPQDKKASKTVVKKKKKSSVAPAVIKGRATPESTRAKLDLLFENSPFGFAFCDMNGRYVDVNRKFSEITGYSPEELRELSPGALTPSKYKPEEEKMRQSLQDTGRYGPFEKEFVRKSGELITVELNGFIVEDYDGQKGIWSVVADLTEKRKIEEELAKQIKLAQHHTKLASIGELAAGVGHEINNPLAIAMGYMDALKDAISDAEGPDSEHVMMISKAETALDRIRDIVQGLRAFARSDSEEIKEFVVQDVVEESVRMLRDIYQKSGIKVFFENSEPEKAFVAGNRGRLQQVLVNLISNAKDAVCEAEDPQIDVEFEIAGNFACISVQDNGSGIPENLREKIFEPFFTTKEVNKGTGIGLAMVHSIVQEHGGHLEVSSEEGVGSKFSIFLPRVEGSASASETSPSLELDDGGRALLSQLNAHVLVVDDEDGMREYLRHLLEFAGLKVTAAANGLEALHVFCQEPFDLVISDMKMPVMDGEEFLKKVRGLQEENPTPFVFVTGGVNVDFEGKDSELKNMIDGYLYKPFQRKALLSMVSSLLIKNQVSEKESA